MSSTRLESVGFTSGGGKGFVVEDNVDACTAWMTLQCVVGCETLACKPAASLAPVPLSLDPPAPALPPQSSQAPLQRHGGNMHPILEGAAWQGLAFSLLVTSAV